MNHEPVLKTIKYSEDKRKITFICPVCQGLTIVTRIQSDPENSLYVIAMCDECRDNKSYGLIFYDKYGIILKVENPSESDEDDDEIEEV